MVYHNKLCTVVISSALHILISQREQLAVAAALKPKQSVEFKLIVTEVVHHNLRENAAHQLSHKYQSSQGTLQYSLWVVYVASLLIHREFCEKRAEAHTPPLSNNTLYSLWNAQQDA